MIYLNLVLISGILLFSCSNSPSEESGIQSQTSDQIFSELDTATFAGGCFWCVEASFDQIRGVEEAVSGYAGGQKEDPAYQEVASGRTEYAETVQIYYQPQVISYEQLLEIFFTAHDPTQFNRQGPDIGKQYRSAIFYHNKEQLETAQKKIRALNESGKYKKEIVTELNPYKKFYKAEKHHQDYAKKHPEDGYIQRVSMPKIKEVRKKFPDLLKE